MKNKDFALSDYLYGGNVTFIQELYKKFLANPTSVDPEWVEIFEDIGDDIENFLLEFRGPSWAPKGQNQVIGYKEKSSDFTVNSDDVERACADSIGALMLIRAYRVRGHLYADTDPLKLQGVKTFPDLDPATYGFSEADYDREIYLGGSLGIERSSLGDIINKLQKIYCSSIGAEFMHIESLEQREWLEEHLEVTHNNETVSNQDKVDILQKIIEVESFENFLHVKFPGTKRFSIEGAESTIPAMEAAIESAAQHGVKEVIIGMAHRGRLNVLTSVMGKSYAAMLAEFQGALAHPETLKIAGDVKYHLGTSSDREFEGGNEVHLSLTANPSHLEAVNPVVAGKVRAKQDVHNDISRDKILGVLIHGDAAFAGQGVVGETLALGDLKGYTTGGTIHIIINNQIGFTTSPKSARLSPYPTEVAKIVQAPIFHVNGDDPQAAVAVSKIASEFRSKFKKDVVIDIVCYRRYGHNEGDEPMFTQPLMYKAIKNLSTPMEVYANELIKQGVITEAKYKEMLDTFHKFLEEQFKEAKDYQQNKADWLEGKWSGFSRPEDGVKPHTVTGVSNELIEKVSKTITKNPDGISLHSKLVRQLNAKKKMFDEGKNLDWATGEALAFGTLLSEGHPVRFSGQDVCRGTFSQRHAVLVDQETEKRYTPLNSFGDDQEAKLEIIDSNLSEFAVLGFEYGYSMVDPRCLTLWEAQFGDFANGAQIIFDQFISSSESKWLRMSGIVVLLPHGYEGQGPEHSSARLERFLQMCADDNIQVANCTTPANYFHILRRQLKRNFCKPLVMMTPKSLLRHKLAVSDLDDFRDGTHFKRVIGEVDKLVAKDKVKRVVLCSGKVYYDLYEERAKKNIKDVALVRVEQLYPYPCDDIANEIKGYKNADVVWCQEEPQNMGSWNFIDRLLEESIKKAKLKVGRPQYIGRVASASTAVGYMKLHKLELEEFVNNALSV